MIMTRIPHSNHSQTPSWHYRVPHRSCDGSNGCTHTHKCSCNDFVLPRLGIAHDFAKSLESFRTKTQLNRSNCFKSGSIVKSAERDTPKQRFGNEIGEHDMTYDARNAQLVK
jgi:hypothetical protein